MTQLASQAPSTILDYWQIILRCRVMIGTIVIISVVATGFVSKFLLLKMYEAKAILLTVEDSSMGGGMTFGSGGGKEKGSGGSGMSMAMEALSGRSSGPSKLDVLMSLLNSRRMLESIIEQLNLMSVYGTESKEAAVNTLRGQVLVKQNSFKAIEIMVSSSDPKLAAEIANALAANVDRLNKELALTSTKRNRLFIESRLAEKAKKLAEAENALKIFQTGHNILDPVEQASGAVGVAADLHSQIVSLDVELAALREYATPSHPDILKTQAQIQELKKQLSMMERDQALEIGAKKRSKASLSKKVYPAFEDAPSLTLDLLRLHRQVKVEEAVYGMLVGILEQAKIAEAKDLPTVQVLDNAVPPEFPSKPKTLQNIQVAAAVSLVLGIFLALFMDYLGRLRMGEVRDQMQQRKAAPTVEVPDVQIGNGGQSVIRPVPSHTAGSVRGTL